MLSKFEQEADQVMAGGLQYGGSQVIPFKPSPLCGFVTSDLYAGHAPTPYLIKHMVDMGDLVIVFGESGAMKSFLALDMGMHLATGRTYCGHRIARKIGVLYIAGEGGAGIRRRIMAWLIRHGFDASTEQPAIFVATEQADLMRDTGAILATIKQAEQALKCEIGAVVFDTLAANFGAGDESKAEDMAKVVQTAKTACGDRAIILVHHVGHGDKTRERGSYALRAAADRRILVERQEGAPLVSVTCVKAKDDEPFAPLVFEWRVVDVGWTDIDGDSLTSIILESTEKRPAKGPVGRVQKSVFDAIKNSGTSLRRPEIVDHLAHLHIHRATIYRAINSMLEAGVVIEGYDKISIPEDVQ